jgi:predicted dehydrogenase
MSRRTSIVLVGIGGYGNSYVTELLDTPKQNVFVIAGAVDPSPASCKRLTELQARGVPIYPGLESFYAESRADLAIIASPLHFHASHTCLALASGSHVLCEKPLCVTPDDACRMSKAQSRSGKQVAVGYQWSFSEAIQELKRDILAGLLGKPIRLRTLVLWPRDERYYHRNRWAGAKQTPDGIWILDSPANNACAHFLHNMLYVLGDHIDAAASPRTVIAELYRACPIQNFDTAAIRCCTANDVELLFFTSHAVGHRQGPRFIYEFEKATVSFVDGKSSEITAAFNDGRAKTYGSPDRDKMRKLWLTITSIEKDSVNGGDAICGIDAAAAQTRCNWAIQASSPRISAFPQDIIVAQGATGERQLTVDGLPESLIACYEQRRLPSELGFAWAQPGKTITLQAEKTATQTYRSDG